MENFSIMGIHPPSLLIRAIVEYLSSIITILLNTLFIITIIRSPPLRTPSNILLLNSALNLICSCLTFLLSVSIALQYSITHSINLHLCRMTGYLISSFCHGIMYSYLLLSINRVLNIFYRSKTNYLSIKLIIIEMIFQWLFAFLIPSVSFILNRIDFQIKSHVCSARKPFYMTLGVFTGFFLPVIFITVFNLIIYFHVSQVRTNMFMSIGNNKSKQLNRISQRFHQRRIEKKFKLLRQFAAFSCVFIIGWGFFACISIFDTKDIVSEDIYLIALSFPSLSLLIITFMIINWNHSIKKSMLNLCHIHSRKGYSRSATTVQFSTPLSYDCS